MSISSFERRTLLFQAILQLELFEGCDLLTSSCSHAFKLLSARLDGSLGHLSLVHEARRRDEPSLYHFQD